MLQARTGLQHPHRGAPSSGGQGDILPLVPGSSRPAPKAPRASPDDLATELNPDEPELNPHEAAPAASRARTDHRGFRARASARRRGSWQRRSCHAACDPLRPRRSATATGRASAQVSDMSASLVVGFAIRSAPEWMICMPLGYVAESAASRRRRSRGRPGPGRPDSPARCCDRTRG
jgi:hypothetical protein